MAVQPAEAEVDDQKSRAQDQNDEAALEVVPVVYRVALVMLRWLNGCVFAESDL